MLMQGVELYYPTTGKEMTLSPDAPGRWQWMKPLHMTEFLRSLHESPDLHGINSADSPFLDNLLLLCLVRNSLLDLAFKLIFSSRPFQNSIDLL